MWFIQSQGSPFQHPFHSLPPLCTGPLHRWAVSPVTIADTLSLTQCHSNHKLTAVIWPLKQPSWCLALLICTLQVLLYFPGQLGEEPGTRGALIQLMPFRDLYSPKMDSPESEKKVTHWPALNPATKKRTEDIRMMVSLWRGRHGPDRQNEWSWMTCRSYLRPLEKLRPFCICIQQHDTLFLFILFSQQIL